MKSLILKDLEHYEFEYIKKILPSFKCSVEKFIYRSTFNKYVYFENREPFIIDSYKVEVWLSGVSCYIDYLDFTLTKRKENIKFLEDCYNYVPAI